METVRVSYVKKLWRQLILWRHLGEKFKFVGLTMLISLLVEIWFFVSNVHRLTDFSFTPMGVVSCYNSKILAPRFRMFCWFAMLKDGWLLIRVSMLMLSNFLSSPSFTSISAFTCFPVRGERGGSPKIFLIFLLFTYVIALDILFPKWAHLPSNSARLPRCDPSK